MARAQRPARLDRNFCFGARRAKRRSPTIIEQFTVATRATAWEYFGYFILRATGLLVFVRVVTLHTTLVNCARLTMSATCPLHLRLRPNQCVGRADETCQIQTFRPHRASNRLDGSRSESGKPARHIGAIVFILGSVALAERRLLIGNYDNVKKEPDRRAVAEEMPVSE